ncbi:MAG: hypothetical protein Q9212_007034 [Teloschistes hypoglaucus]
MVFKVVPAEPSDIPAIASMQIAAFEEDPIMGQLMPKATYQDQYDYFANFYRKNFAEKHLTGSVFHKVVETETGKLVAFAKWKYAYSLTTEEQEKKEKLDTKRTYPEGTNVVLYEQFFGELDRLRKKNCDGYKDYCKLSRLNFAMPPLIVTQSSTSSSSIRLTNEKAWAPCSFAKAWRPQIVTTPGRTLKHRPRV